MKNRILFFLIAFLLTTHSFKSYSQVTERVEGKLYSVNEGVLCPINEDVVTVKLKSHYNIDKEIEVLRSNILGYIDLKVPKGKSVESYVTSLKASGKYELVKFAELGELCFNTNDPSVSNQWYLNAINIFNAWNITTGNPNIKVAVLDREVDWNHNDLGYGFDNFKNIDASLGYNYMEQTSSAVNPHYHGTGVAGIIGAKTNNNRFIAGVSGGNNSSGITLIPYCVGSNTCYMCIEMSTVDDAIIDATNKGVKVINMSFRSTSNYHPDIDAAIEYAYNHGVTLVAAAGNDNISQVMYPANNPKVVAVGSVGSNLVRSNFSNYGIGIDLVAPGENITSLSINNDYQTDSGTSFSAPQVSGVIALMLSVNPTLTPEEIQNILRNTAQKNTGYIYTNGWNNQVGYGLLDAYAAVIASIVRLSTLSAPSAICTTATAYINNTPTDCTINWSVSNSCMQITSGQGTDSVTLQRNDDGWTTLTATISYNGTVVKTLSKEIMVGTPAFCMNITPVAADGSQGYWRSDLNGNSIDVEFVNSNAHYPSYVVDLYRIDNGFSVGTHLGHWVTTSLSDMTFGYYPQGWYYIEVVGVNDCGTSTAWGTELECLDGNDLQNRMFSFVYEQSSAMLTVTLNPNFERAHKLSRKQVLGESASVGNYEVQLWNENTLLRSYKTTDAQLQIPMSGMKSGLYVVRAIIDGQSQQRKLIKK